MGWILIGLSLVGLLPFAITAYQIQASREGLVEQVQQTHLIAVLSKADSVGSYLELLTSLAKSAALNPNLYQDPGSESAQEILIGLLRTQNDVVSAGIIQSSENGSGSVELVQAAQSREHSAAAQSGFKENSLQPYQLIRADNRDWLLITQALENTNLSVRLLAKQDAFNELMTPTKELEEADLGLFTRNGVRLSGLLGTVNNFPNSFQQKLATRQIRSAFDQFNFSDGTRGVASFAEVPNTDWIVVSRQPAKKAELVSQRLLQQAFIAFGFVFLLAALFAWASKRKIIEPIQEMIRKQRKLARIDLDEVGGSEIEQLKIGFALLEQNVSDRKALDKMFLGRYQVVEVIASGAMGTVFKGFDPRLERDVALKTIKIGELRAEFNRAELAKQLVNEARLVAKLHHPNIVTVYDAVDAGESALVAMEFIKGMSLSDYMQQRPSIPPMQVIALAIGMLRGLGAAHNAGIVHRDIKPGNILLGFDGEIKLTDFGIADLVIKSKENTSGQVVGTPGFVSPELLKGAAYSKRSDLFAMGVLLYYCATQRLPFPGRNVKRILQDTIDKDPPHPIELVSNMPAALSNAIMYLLQKDVKNRPQDAEVIADALEKEFGIIKWVPPKNADYEDVDPSTTAETRILAETVIRKHLRNIEE